MRDANRLDDFYDFLKDVHKAYFPDWRFGQFVANIQSYCGNDLFYYEEEQIVNIVKSYVFRHFGSDRK